MKSWPAVTLMLTFVVLAFGARVMMRHRFVAWLARPSRGGSWGRALLLFGGSTVLALVALAGGYACRSAGGEWSAGRFVAAALVIGAYLPVATLGSPRMTRWQKSFDQRLLLQGATTQGAHAVASIASPVSALAVIVAAAAVPLLF